MIRCELAATIGLWPGRRENKGQVIHLMGQADLTRRGKEDVVMFEYGAAWVVGSTSFWFKDWRLIWTNKPGRDYCESAEQGSRIHISA